MNSENPVCRVTMDLEIGAARPELEALIAKLTADGLPCDSGWTHIEGERTLNR